MRKFTHSAALIAAFLAIASIDLVQDHQAEAAEHPRLVSVDAAKCGTCHAKITRGFEVVHPPVEDDCTSCHDVVVGAEGTTVDLSATEPDLCVMCHDGLEDAASGEITAPHAPVADSCTNCHEVHAGRNEHLLLESPLDLCAGCHDGVDLKESHQGQWTKSTNCVACHSPHGSEHAGMLLAENQHSPFADRYCEACHRDPFGGRIRLRARGEKVCEACHGDVTEGAGEGGSVHAALVGSRAKTGCLNCHDPHMSPNPKFLVEPGVELCATCHDAVVQGAVADTGHAPAAEDCLNCHAPHASANAILLSETTPDLCLMCHDPDDETLAAAHLGANLGSLDCISCHSPHGEGNEHLLATNVHAAILDGCDTCHEGSSSQLVEDGESSLCLACHDDIGELASSATVAHPAMELARCADCHNPHASAQDKLVIAAAGAECTVCHEDQTAGPDEVAHGAITVIGCRACHEPHGGENGKLLRLEGNELCLACHDSSMVRVDHDAETFDFLGRFTVPAEIARASAVLKLTGEHGHPVSDHRVMGVPTKEELLNKDVTFTGELTCYTCHDPHKGASRLLFTFGARTAFEACAACHPK